MPDSSPPPVNLDLRLVRCFTVLAEHRHFGRAAAALHTTQPTLSRQIHRLEQQLGACLLDRTTRGTELTEAGEVFLPLARTLLRSAARAMARTRAAAQPTRITVGYTTNLIVTPAVRELRHRHPEADVRTLHLAWNDSREAPLDHRVDAVVARLPVPDRPPACDGPLRRTPGARGRPRPPPGRQGFRHRRRHRRRAPAPG